MLNWILHNSPVLSNGEVYFDGFDEYEVTSASFGTIAIGGFDSATFAIRDVPESVVMDAVKSDWLMKELRATDAEGARAYEGFVAQIKGRVGKTVYGLDLDPMVNRARVEFWEPDPLHKGSRRKGIHQLNDALSQAKYGIKEEKLDLTNEGTIGGTQADAKGYGFLELTKAPHSFEFDLGDTPPQPNTLELTVRGYWNTTKWRLTNWAVLTAKDLSAIFYTAGNNKSFMTLYLNGYYLQFFNRANVTNIKNCNISVKWNTSHNLMTMQEAMSIVDKNADGNKRRAYFQLWEDRVPYLAVRDTDAAYYTAANDGRTWTKNYAPIPAYMVRAGGYILDESYPGNLAAVTDVAAQENASFIQMTTYDDLTGRTRTTEPQYDFLPLILGKVMGKVRYANLS